MHYKIISHPSKQGVGLHFLGVSIDHTSLGLVNQSGEAKYISHDDRFELANLYGVFNFGISGIKGLMYGFWNSGFNLIGNQFGVINDIDNIMTGGQLGIINGVGNVITGNQVGFINTVDTWIEGIQRGFFNQVTYLHGVQFGFLNRLDENIYNNSCAPNHGLQRGVINYCKTINYFEGCPGNTFHTQPAYKRPMQFGLINVIHKAYARQDKTWVDKGENLPDHFQIGLLCPTF